MHQYFQSYWISNSARRFTAAPGCLELFQQFYDKSSDYNPQDFVGNRQRARNFLENLDLEPYLLQTRIPGLAVMKAGMLNDDYARHVSLFDWSKLFSTTVGLFAGVADFLRARFDYVLIDSRTGITDTSGICTMLLPDKLVVVFTPNQQSLTGVETLVRKAIAYRKDSPDGRPLAVFPLPSRVEMARPQLLATWRKGTDSGTTEPLPDEMRGYQPTFERLFAQLYVLPEICLDEYFNEVMLQHIPDYAYGEPVAVELEKNESRISLSRSYAAFRDRLIELDVPWTSLKIMRLEREIVQRCDQITAHVSNEKIEEALRLSLALLEQELTLSMVDRIANTVLHVARSAYSQNPKAASALLRQGSHIALAESRIDPATLGQVLFDAGKLSRQFDDLSLSAELLEISSKRFSDYFGVEHPATFMAMDELAAALRDGGKFAEARVLDEELLGVKRKVFGEEHPSTLASMSNLALNLQLQGDLAGAHALQSKTLEIGRRVLGEKHPNTLVWMDNLASTLRAQGDLSDANTLQEKGLEISRMVLGEDHQNTLTSMSNLALTLQAQGDFAGARALHEKALGIGRRVLGEEHPSTLTSLSNLAMTLQAQGDLAGARTLQEKVLESGRRTIGAEHPNLLTSMNNLASTLHAQGDLSGARALLEKVLEIGKRVLGEEHPTILSAMNNLASSLQTQGELAGARILQEKGLEICRRTLVS